MSNRYRVIVWGPGHVGGAALRECLRRPEFEVVGARVWSPEKDGLDIGELAGAEPTGVKATSDTDALVDTDADCVIHTPFPPLDETEMTADVIRLLESGKNVISSQSYYNPWAREPEVAERLERACKAGNATLVGTGLHPGFVTERLMMTLTGLFTEIGHLRLVQQVDCAKLLAENPLARDYVGWGVPVEDIGEYRIHTQMTVRVYRDMSCLIANRLFGAAPEDVRMEVSHRGIPAEEQLECGPVVIKPGQAKTIVYEFNGYIGDHHFYTGEEYWYLGEENRTIDGLDGTVSYLMEATGKPAALRMRLGLDSVMGDDASLTNYVTAAPLVQAIVPTCEAKPGFLVLEPPAYCTTDLSRLAPSA